MTRKHFANVMEHIYEFEGGFVNHPNDPGGATNLGITHRTLSAARGAPVTVEDVRNLRVAEANGIYRNNYWNKIRGDHLKIGFDLITMDSAVNSGPSRGAKWTQLAVGVPADGRVGPVTIEAVHRAWIPEAENACERRLLFLQGLRHWRTFKRGWSRRVAAVQVAAVEALVNDTHARDAKAELHEVADRAEARKSKAERDSKAVATGGVTAGGGGGGLGIDVLPWYGVLAIVAVIAVITYAAFRRQRNRAKYQRDVAQVARERIMKS